MSAAHIRMEWQTTYAENYLYHWKLINAPSSFYNHNLETENWKLLDDVSFLSFLYSRRVLYGKYMSNAFVFLNCDIGTEPAILNEITDIPGVSEAVQLSGVYDIVAKVSEQSREDIAKSVRKIRTIANIKSSLTMIVSEEEQQQQQRSAKQIEERLVQ